MSLNNLPNIFICGDPHENFRHIVEAVLEHRPDAVILLGDNTPVRPLEVELDAILGITDVWWIHGNHDTDREDYFDNLFGSKLADRNLHGRVMNIAGIRVAGLGGIFRSKIWDDDSKQNASPEAYLKACGKGNRWRDGLPLRHRSTIFRSDVAKLSRETADLLVTHEAPAYHPFGSQVLSDLAEQMRVTTAFHGHHHQDRDYPNTVWHGVGLRGIAKLDGTAVLPGEIEGHG